MCFKPIKSWRPLPHPISGRLRGMIFLPQGWGGGGGFILENFVGGESYIWGIIFFGGGGRGSYLRFISVCPSKVSKLSYHFLFLRMIFYQEPFRYIYNIKIAIKNSM